MTLPVTPKRVFKIAARPETGEEFVWVYRAESEGPFVLQPEEIDAGGWFSAAQIEEWLRTRPEELAPSFVFIWRALRDS